MELVPHGEQQSGDPTFEQVLARVERERPRLTRLFPDMDPGDLHSILVAIFQPFGTGRHFLLRRVRPGVHVF
jgi:hypothetical protein